VRRVPAIDRPLTAEQQAAVRALSRRVQLTSSQAVFTYSYADVRGDPLAVLAEQFDLMLYLVNWGSRQLAFRLPRAAVDRDQLTPYVDAVDEVELTETARHLVLSIAFHQEEPPGWVEGEGRLAFLTRAARGAPQVGAEAARRERQDSERYATLVGVDEAGLTSSCTCPYGRRMGVGWASGRPLVSGGEIPTRGLGVTRHPTAISPTRASTSSASSPRAAVSPESHRDLAGVGSSAIERSRRQPQPSAVASQERAQSGG
jgi:hypothetical protein